MAVHTDAIATIQVLLVGGRIQPTSFGAGVVVEMFSNNGNVIHSYLRPGVELSSDMTVLSKSFSLTARVMYSALFLHVW